jgi:hypothetical protein
VCSVALAGLMSFLHGSLDMKSIILGKYHYVLYFLVLAMQVLLLFPETTCRECWLWSCFCNSVNSSDGHFTRPRKLYTHCQSLFVGPSCLADSCGTFVFLNFCHFLVKGNSKLIDHWLWDGSHGCS